jgi:ERCC4-type nuclease
MTEPEPGYEVILDYTEPTAVQRAFESTDDVRDVLIGDLPAADIVIGDVGFERKTPEDYASSLADGRLDDQARRMGEAFDHAYVLIEGNHADFKALTHTKMRPSSLWGHIASLTARSESGVRAVYPCGDLALLADYAVRTARKHNEDPTPAQLPPDDFEEEYPMIVKIIAQADGVGVQTAQRIATEFPSVPLVQTAIEEGVIEEVEGVGPKTTDSLRTALIREHEEEDG